MSAVFQLDPDAERLSVGSSNSFELKGKVFGATSYSDAVSAVLTNLTLAPVTMVATIDTGYGSFPWTFMRAAVKVDPIVDLVSARSGAQPSIWSVTLTYDLVGYSHQPNQVGDQPRTFEIGRDMVNRKVSLSGSDAGSYGTSPPNMKGAIGVDAQLNVAGVEVPVPTFKWTETHYVLDSFVTTSQVAAWYAVAANPISKYTFRSFAAYEALFLGVSGSIRHRGGDWELNFSFAASPNMTSLTVGSITGISKKGWQYLWPRVVPYQSAPGDPIIPKIQHVYVDDVIGASGDGSSDFAVLGIGTT